MKTGNRFVSLLATATALAALAGFASAAEAIVVVDSKTGMFTLTQGEGARAWVANTGDELGIIVIGGKVVDADGNTLAAFPPRRVAFGQATSFEFAPRLAEGERVAVRVELMVEAKGRPLPCILTLEAFDVSTGATRFDVNFSVPPPDDSRPR